MAERRGPRSNGGYDDRYEYAQEGRGRERGGDQRQTDHFEDVSSYSSHREYHKRRKNKKGKSAIKGILAVLCTLLVLVGGGLIFLSTYVFSGLTTTSLSKNPTDLGIDENVVSDEKIKNIALFGLDARGDSLEGRSDAIIVLSIDSRHGKMKMTSILRDSLVSIDGYGEDKITHAYVYGGPQLAVKTINQNFNLDITDYVSVNFYKMAEIVDSFGGTNVTITEAEREQIIKNLELLVNDDPNAVVTQEDYDVGVGDVTLTGNQAVAYARIRYIDGDDQRASRQQNVLKGLLARVKNMGMGDYIHMARTVLPLCDTSIGTEDIPSFIPALSGIELESLSIPGPEENATGANTSVGWVFMYDLTAAAQHIDAFIKEEGSPYYSTYQNAQ